MDSYQWERLEEKLDNIQADLDDIKTNLGVENVEEEDTEGEQDTSDDEIEEPDDED